MKEDKSSLFYGPVASRRFGYSLGIDLIPYKVCSFDCIYCQLGKTTIKTTERKRYKKIDFKDFTTELKEIINSTEIIDYITFSGCGEPTLNSDIGILIDSVKEITDIPVAVLTNGSILDRKDVVKDLLNADLIKISLDGCNEDIFRKINRPCCKITLNNIINGINLLLQSYKGRIWLEIMVLKGINDGIDAATDFKNVLLQDNKIYDRVEKIHINTPVRPSGFKKVFTPSARSIQALRDILGKKSQTISPISEDDFNSFYYKKDKKLSQRIVELAKRRPVTTKDISIALEVNINEIIKCLRSLLESDKIKYKIYKDNRYYYL